MLQQAFTPNNVTAQPSARSVGSTAPGRGSRTEGGFGEAAAVVSVAVARVAVAVVASAAGAAAAA